MEKLKKMKNLECATLLRQYKVGKKCVNIALNSDRLTLESKIRITKRFVEFYCDFLRALTRVEHDEYCSCNDEN